MIPSVRKLAGLMTWTLVLGVGASSALKCYGCEMEECEDPANGEVLDCPKESSVCVKYVDVTGRALNKGPGYIFRKLCGAGFQGGPPNCKQATNNIDICTCSKDFCNGNPVPKTRKPKTKTKKPATVTTVKPNGNSTDTDNTTTTTERIPFEFVIPKKIKIEH